MKSEDTLFWGLIALCILNIIAAIAGIEVGWNFLQDKIDFRVPSWITVIGSILLFGALFFFWVEAGLSGIMGTLIMVSYCFFAPFGYVGWGLPVWLSIVLALSPPFIWNMAHHVESWSKSWQTQKEKLHKPIRDKLGK